MSDQPTSSPDPIEDAAHNDSPELSAEMTPVPHEHGDARNEESDQQG